MFKKILIANRGEIAVRVIRGVQALGIKAIAIYSDADEKALFRRLADESYALGDSAPSQSYLNISKIIEIAKKSKADAIHPGYGFLSENANFAEACEKAGIVFIGPPSGVIRQMGDKIGARTFLKKHGVPLVPGTEEPLNDVEKAKAIAKEVGYPIMIKAAAGGGGRGMRVVREDKELQEALESARRESKGAFGDDRVFLEKFVENPHHIEFQILADSHGDVRHLFERECSIQRRHQKVIEETPSPLMDEALRKKMGSTAVAIAKKIGYVNAGTIEFIVDAQKNFYFLEVNTRLQVEHPITEMITGVDLVKAQVRVAEGGTLTHILGSDGSSRERGISLDLSEHPALPVGAAIECRICAEDPEKNFMPSIGTITRFELPQGEGIRFDGGIYEGWTIPMEYDPMLAKLIVHAPTREKAILKMLDALGELKIEGVKTNIPFLIDLLRHRAFTEGQTDTGFIERYFKNWFPSYFVKEDPFSPWALTHKLLPGVPGPSPRRGRGDVSSHGGNLRVRGEVKSGDPTAPMPGTVRKILVAEGEKVTQGTALIVIEAMKMEHAIEASHDGTVKKIFYAVGDKVGMGDKLVEIS